MVMMARSVSVVGSISTVQDQPNVQALQKSTFTIYKTNIKVDKIIQCDLESPQSGEKERENRNEIGDRPMSTNHNHNTTKSFDATVSTGTTANNVITHTELFQLLAVLMQMSEDRSITRSNMVKAVMSHVFNIIDQPHDDIRQAIHQHYSETPSTSKNVKSTAHNDNKENCKTISGSKPYSNSTRYTQNVDTS